MKHRLKAYCEREHKNTIWKYISTYKMLGTNVDVYQCVKCEDARFSDDLVKVVEEGNGN